MSPRGRQAARATAPSGDTACRVDGVGVCGPSSRQLEMLNEGQDVCREIADDPLTPAREWRRFDGATRQAFVAIEILKDEAQT